MYELVRARIAGMALARETVAGVVALLVAELFYKFGSFSLECLAFLATWYAFGMVLSRVWRPARERAAKG
jgi:hypothetical protein